VTSTSPRTANATYGAVALVATLVLSTSIGKSIWTDDAASLYSARLSWAQLWRQSHIVDRVYLPYYALLHVWLLVNTSVEWARIPSLVAYAVTVFLVGRLGYRFRGFWCGLMAAFLCASSPLLVQEALGVRPYALTAMTATLSVTFLVGWLENEKNWQMWCFAIAAVVTAVLQLFAALVPLVALVAVLALRHRAVKERWRYLVAPLGFAFVASLAFALYTLGQRKQINWIHHFTLSSFVIALYGPAGGNDRADRIAYTLLTAFLLVVGAVAIFRSRSRLKAVVARQDLNPFVVAAAWAILPSAILIVASFVSPIDVNRYLTDSTPGLALLVALVVTLSFQLRDEKSRRAPIVRVATVSAAVILMIVSAILSARYLAENTQQGMTRLASDVRSSGAVALPNRLVDEEFEIYLGTKHLALWPLIADPRTFNEMDLRSLPLSSTPRNVWLVTDSSSTDAATVFIKILRADGYKRVAVQKYPDYVGLYLNDYRR
jgi:uncharacterized membrane protein